MRLARCRSPAIAAIFAILGLAGCAPTAHLANASDAGRGVVPVVPRLSSERPSAMDTQDTGNAPKLRGEEVSGRVLKLIDSIRSRADLSPDNIRRATGIAVAFDPDDPSRYGFHGRVDEAWWYDLGSVVDQVDGGVRGLEFFFAAPGRPDADPAAVCSPDLDGYRKRLEAMGFTASPVRGERDQLRYWEFVRGAVRVRATVAATADDAHHCVRLIAIDA
jgi:hypothetical protein